MMRCRSAVVVFIGVVHWIRWTCSILAFTPQGNSRRWIHPLLLLSSELRSLSVNEIRTELKDRGVSFSDCFDKESLVLRLKEARENENKNKDDDSVPEVKAATPVPKTDDSLETKQIREDLLAKLRSMKVRDLRAELALRNVRWSGILEKEDLVQTLLKARMREADFSVTGVISPGQVGDVTGEQLELELTQTESPLLLDAYAVWCGPCQMMAPQLAEAAQELGDRVRVAKMDTDKYPEQASKLKVKGLPTLILFLQGKEQGRIEGALMKGQLLDWVESYLPPESPNNA